jgi:hypothetical protein
MLAEGRALISGFDKPTNWIRSCLHDLFHSQRSFQDLRERTSKCRPLGLDCNLCRVD